jgi:hypothetical protein
MYKFCSKSGQNILNNLVCVHFPAHFANFANVAAGLPTELHHSFKSTHESTIMNTLILGFQGATPMAPTLLDHANHARSC